MRNEALQALCRSYLVRLRYVARKHGLGAQVASLLRANRRGECEATEREVMMLSRCVDDERVARDEIPELLGKSYRRCVEDDDFRHLRRLPSQGTYSKPDVLLYKKSKKRS